MIQHPAAVLVLVEDVGVVELVQNGPELALGVAAELAEITHAQGVQRAVPLLDQRNGLFTGHQAVADVAGGVVGGGSVAELGVFQPGVYQIGAGVNLVEVFHMMAAIPLVGQVVEAAALGQLVVLVAVPGQEVAHVEGVKASQLLGGGGLGQSQVVRQRCRS